MFDKHRKSCRIYVRRNHIHLEVEHSRLEGKPDSRAFYPKSYKRNFVDCGLHLARVRYPPAYSSSQMPLSSSCQHDERIICCSNWWWQCKASNISGAVLLSTVLDDLGAMIPLICKNPAWSVRRTVTKSLYARSRIMI